MDTPVLPPTTPDSVLSLAILQVLTEVCVQLKLDPDGSLTTSRVMGAVGGFGQVADALAAPSTPLGLEAQAARAAAHAHLKRMRPLVSRLALAAAADL